MAVQSETSLVQYAGNNSTSVAYPVPFRFFSNAHLQVVVLNSAGVETALDLDSGFTATGAGDDEGGEILTSEPWDNTHTITIQRVMPATQPYSYEEGQRLPMRTLEENFDWIVLLAQQLAGTAGPGANALKFPISEPFNFRTQLPTPVQRRDTVVFFDPLTGEMQTLRLDQLAQRLLVILGAEAVLPYRTREVSSSQTITQEDVNSSLRFNSNSDLTVTLPVTNDFSEEFFCAVSRFGNGAVSFVAADGVQIVSSVGQSPRIFGLYKPIGIQRIGVNRWWVYGDIY